MKILDLFIAFVVSSVSYGQIYYNELIDLGNGNPEVYRDILFDSNTNSFWTFGAVSNSTQPKAFHFDPQCAALDTFNVKNNTLGDRYYAPFGVGATFVNGGEILLTGQVSYDGYEGNGIISKFNENGDTIWVKELGDSIFYDELLSVIQDTDSTYVFAGSCGTFISNLIVDYWLVKTDTNGNVLWQNNFGGGGTDRAMNVVATADGGYLMGGGTGSFGNGGNDWYIVKTDALGSMIWEKWYGTSGSEGCFVKLLDDGNFLAYGFYDFENPSQPSQNATHAVVMKLDQNGNPLWEKTFMNHDSASTNFYTYWEWFTSVVLVNDGFVFSGVSMDSLDGNPLGWIVKTDFNGNELWSRRYRKRNNDNYLQDVVALPNGDLVFTGFVFTEMVGQTQDGWLLRTNCLGFDGPPLANGIWHNGSLNTVVLENDSERFGDGIVYWGDGMSTAFTEFDDSLISHSYAVSGNYNIQLIVNACTESDTITISADASVTGLHDDISAQPRDFNLYPNPASNQITIELPSETENGELIIQNLAGQVMFQSSNFNQDVIQIDINDFARGTYLVSFLSEQQAITKKLIVN